MRQVHAGFFEGAKSVNRRLKELLIAACANTPGEVRRAVRSSGPHFNCRGSGCFHDANVSFPTLPAQLTVGTPRAHLTVQPTPQPPHGHPTATPHPKPCARQWEVLITGHSLRGALATVTNHC